MANRTLIKIDLLSRSVQPSTSSGGGKRGSDGPAVRKDSSSDVMALDYSGGVLVGGLGYGGRAL